MGYLKYVRDLWKKPRENNPNYRDRLLKLRREPATVRLKRPTRIDKARSLGYRAKPGILVIRQKVPRGGRKREDWAGGRRTKAQRRLKIVGKNYRQVAEERASKKFTNCEVLNSYYVAEDGQNFWYEVLLVDRDHPQILKDKKLSWISKKKGRATRGITSAGRKSRGLRNKGKGAEKIRPGGRKHLNLSRTKK